jgi:hypothetical protein
MNFNCKFTESARYFMISNKKPGHIRNVLH